MSGLAAVTLVYLAFTIICSSALDVQDVDKSDVQVEIVKNITEFEMKYGNHRLRRLIPEKNILEGGKARATQFSYKYVDGSRIAGDRLLARGFESQEFSKSINMKQIIQFPDPPTDPSVGSIINYFEITVTQSSNIGGVYIADGGIGYRRIKIVVEIGETLFYSMMAYIYGYN